MTLRDVKDPVSIAVTAEAVERARRNASQAWNQAAKHAFRETALRYELFTALDFWRTFRTLYGTYADTGTPRKCASGAVMREGPNRGVAQKTSASISGPSCGVVQPGEDRKVGHTKTLPVWRSLIYDPFAPPLAKVITGREQQNGNAPA